MIEALDPKKPIDHICEGDTEDPTKWHLKRLTIAEEIFISQMAVKSTQEGGAEKVFEYTITALHVGLIGADNFQLNGKDVKFERDNKAEDVIPGSGVKPLKQDVLATIPRAVRDELAGVIVAGGKVADLKNS